LPTTAGKPVTVREALSGLPSKPCPTAEPCGDVPGWHVAAGIGLAMLARYTLVRPGRRVADLPDSLQPATAEAFRRRRILPRRPFRQRGYRLVWDRPAPTLTGHCADELIHPEANRPLTVRECARLQGFGDGHDFRAPLTRPHNSESQDAYALVGDSVCPTVAMAWGEVIKELIHEGV
jgi:DNA (cytosine-5)-methyltransferase 1